MKRLALYVHHDPKGNVRDYVLYCLKGLQEVVNDILFVVNGSITPQAYKDVEKLGVKILVRENKGFDWWGWKAGIEYFGYDKIAEYDELLLTNNTYYGPIYPFSEMWNEMDKRDCDFWGIAQHPRTDKLWIKNDPYSINLQHIQSYWLVFKKKLLLSDDFRLYWSNIPMHHTAEEMIGYGETKLTDFFNRHGYKHDTYLTFEETSKLGNTNPCFFTYKYVAEKKMPIIKRKYFYDPNYYDFDFSNSNTSGPNNLLHFLNDKKLYNTDFIWDDLLTIAPMSEIANRLNLNYVLPVTKTTEKIQNNKLKAVVVMYIYPADLIEYNYLYAKQIPEHIDIIIVNTSADVQKECKNIFSSLKNKIDYRLQQNRGRDNTALLVTCKDAIKKYDLLCFVHAKKSPYFDFLCNGDHFRNHNFASLLYNKYYIENVLNVFQDNNKCGLLVPFIPTSSHYRNILDNKWGINWKNAKTVLNEKFKLNIEPDANVMGPWGGMFWCRTKSLKTLMEYNWSFEDFPEEPLPKFDGLLTHSLERLTSTLVQHAGYYTAWIIPIPLAQEALSNLYYTIVNKKNITVSSSDVYQYYNNIIRYYRYKVLSKITFGKTRKRYKQKRKELKNKIKQVRAILK